MTSVNDSTDKNFSGKEIPLAASVDTFPRSNNQIHAPGPDLDAEKTKIWKSRVLISYSVRGIVHAFLGPYPDSKLDPEKVEDDFPGREGHKPRVFSHDSFNMSFMSQRIFRSSPLANHTPIYLKWLEKVETLKASVWRKLGISNLIQLSKMGLEYDEKLILVVMHLWESSTNTMQLKCCMLTHTLLDVTAITRLPPTGEAYDPDRECDT